MMTAQITCKNCGSSIEIYPDTATQKAKCDVCDEIHELHFTKDHENSILRDCPLCERKDFYSQKDFNRKIGVIIFVMTSLISIFLWERYGPIGLIAFPLVYLVDLFLFNFKKISYIAICYKCQTIFRDCDNIGEIPAYDHEMNDRIVYSDQDFKGVPLDHQ